MGNFGKTARYYSDRLIDEGRVDIIASDCHGVASRRPILSKARGVLETKVGADEASRMVLSRPAAIVLNQVVEPVGRQVLPLEKDKLSAPRKAGLFGRLLKGGGS
jgi:protein-tyrosine phosphatase